MIYYQSLCYNQPNMASPQEEYTYEQLVHYYQVSKTALKNFKDQYPGLGVVLWQSEQDVLTELNKYVTKFGERVIEISDYLDEDEKEGIEIGTYVSHTLAKRRERLFDRIEREKRLFEEDLSQLVSGHEIHLRGMYLELSRMSGKFTADRIQELHRREHWVDTQYDYLMKYYFKTCRQCSYLREIELGFAGERDSLPEASGVYMLFHEGEISYIGHSANINKRIKNHKLVQKSYRNSGPFELECVYALMSISKAKTLEKNLIQIIKPEFNTQSKA